jgi:hypothetical protein
MQLDRPFDLVENAVSTNVTSERVRCASADFFLSLTIFLLPSSLLPLLLLPYAYRFDACFTSIFGMYVER